MSGKVNLFTETFFKKNDYFRKKLKLSISKSEELKVSIYNWIQYLKGFQKTVDGETTDEGQFELLVFQQILGYHGKSQNAKSYTIGGKFRIEGAGVTGGKGEADSCLGQFIKEGKELKGDPQVLIEYKAPSSPDLDRPSSRKDKLSPTGQCWQYLNFFSKAKWGIVTNFNEIRLYNRNEGMSKVQIFYFIVPKELEGIKKSLLDDTELLKFITLLKVDHLLSQDGRPSTTEMVLADQGIEEKKVEKEFYDRYSELRKSLIHELVKDYKGKELLIIELVQKFLDRIIFIWFCEDSSEELLKRNILQNELKGFFKDSATRENVIWESVKGLFNDIDRGNKDLGIPEYNGELFKEDKRLNDLKIANKFFKEIHSISEQYDFGHEDELNVNILGHIFEQSVSELEEIKAQYGGDLYDPDKGKQKRDGIVYTPDFITRYIVENTVGTWLKERFKELETKDPKAKKKKVLSSYLKNCLSKIKIVDPACGSGAFLVEVFDYLRDEYHRVFKELKDLSEDDSTIGLWDDDEIIRSILQDNIYGVDLNFESVEITKLSLYLKTARKDKKLTALKNNIKCGNSLIDSDKFSWETGFKKIIEKKISQFYHITFETKYSREKSKNPSDEAVVLSNEDREIVAQSIAHKTKELGIKILGCAILPDHVHIVMASMGKEIEEIVNEIKGYSAFQVNRTLKGTVVGGGRQMHLWSKGYSKTRIENEEHLFNAVQYVENQYEKHKETWGDIMPPSNLSTLLSSNHPPLPSSPIPSAPSTVPLRVRLMEQTKLTGEKGWEDFEYLEGGFDVVLGNPPYVRQELIRKKDKEFLVKSYETGSGTADLYVYFYEKGYQLLKENGYFGMITSNTFMRTSYGKKLRLFLGEKTNLTNIFNFGDNQFFEGVATRPVITVFNKKINEKQPALFFELPGKKIINTSQFENVIQSEAFEIKASQISESVWSFHKDKKGEALKEKLKNTGVPFGEYTEGKVYRGVLTGLNEAFVIDRETKSRLIEEDAKSEEIIKPWLRGRDIHRWTYDFEDLYLLATGYDLDIPKKYIAVFNHLKQYQEKLEKRWDKGKNWYNLRACAYYEAFEEPKIIYAGMSQIPSFSIELNSCLANDKTFIVGIEDYYLLSLLNSKIAFFYIKMTCQKLLGDTYELKYKDKMEYLPIANNPRDGQLEALGKKQTELHLSMKEDFSYLEALCLSKEAKTLDFEPIDPDFDYQKPLKIKFLRNQLQVHQKAHLFNVHTSYNNVQKDFCLSYLKYLLNHKTKWTVKSKLANALKKIRIPNLTDDEAKDYSETYQKICETQKDIIETDERIDETVYDLYGLTEEEIGIVEESVE